MDFLGFITPSQDDITTRDSTNAIRKHRYNHFMSLNDLEFAYSPVRNQVRDLREYL